MAHYKKMDNGKWLVKFYCKNHKGENEPVFRRGFKTKREAQECMEEHIAKHQGTEKVGLEILIQEFLKYKNFTKHNTIRNNRIISNKIIEYYGKNFDIIKFNEKNILTFLISLSDTPVAQKRAKQFLNAILKFACVYYNLKSNPVDKIVLNIKQESVKKGIWTIEEFKKFDNHFLEYNHRKNAKTRAFFNLLFFSGARAGEISALTLQDIDFNNNTININKTRINVDASNSPKNKTSSRIISIPNNTMQILKEYTSSLPNIQDMFIFATVHAYERILRAYVKNNELEYITLHSFRHSHASLLIDKGLPITEISKRLGHANSQITLSVYAHLYNKIVDNAVETLNNLLD